MKKVPIMQNRKYVPWVASVLKELYHPRFVEMEHILILTELCNVRNALKDTIASTVTKISTPAALKDHALLVSTVKMEPVTTGVHAPQDLTVQMKC